MKEYANPEIRIPCFVPSSKKELSTTERLRKEFDKLKYTNRSICVSVSASDDLEKIKKEFNDKINKLFPEKLIRCCLQSLIISNKKSMFFNINMHIIIPAGQEPYNE